MNHRADGRAHGFPQLVVMVRPRLPGVLDTPRTGSSPHERVIHGRFDTTQRLPTCPTTEKVDR